MTKELSEQICKLCNIQPYKEHFCEFKGLREKCNWQCHSCKFLETAPYKISYPDFGQPENFLQLFNLELKDISIRYDTVAELICYKGGWYSDVKEFLQCLISILDEKECSDKIKQAIKEAEWIYE